MTHYKVQEWPDVVGDDGGDAIIFSSDWPKGDWERHKSWEAAFSWLSGNMSHGDTLESLGAKYGHRPDSYAGAD